MANIKYTKGFSNTSVAANKAFDWSPVTTSFAVGAEENFGKNQSGIIVAAGWADFNSAGSTWTHNTTNETYEYNKIGASNTFAGFNNIQWYRTDMYIDLILERAVSAVEINFNFRTDSGGNGYRVTIAAGSETPTITLASYTSGTPTTITSTTATFTNATQYKLSAKAIDTSLSFLIDDVEILSATDSDYTSGSFYLGMQDVAGAVANNQLTVYNAKLYDAKASI